MLPAYIPQLISALILGFLFSDYFSGRSDGERIERGTRFKIGNYRINFHNWMWSSLVLFGCVLLDITDPITLGIIIGAILQGLTYSDRFIIFYRAKDFEKIYSKFF